MATKTALIFPRSATSTVTAVPVFAYIADDASQTLRMFTGKFSVEEALADRSILRMQNLDFTDLDSVIFAGIWNHTALNTVTDHDTLEEAAQFAVDALARSNSGSTQ